MTTAIESQVQNTADQAVVQPVLLTKDEIIATSVLEAVERYKAKHPGKTDAEIEAFRTVVGISIRASLDDTRATNSHAEREVRQAALNELIDANGIGFKITRLKETLDLGTVTIGGIYRPDYVYSQLVEKNSKMVTSNKGGYTFAYILGIGAKGRLFATVALAICRDDENFDILAGKELAVDRLLNGVTLEVELTHGGMFTNKLSPDQLYNLVCEYADKYLPATKQD
jgi:hypothetical protein